jgi:hypothetical protein
MPESDEQVVELFANACSDRTKVLTFTGVSNVSGPKLPAKKRPRWHAKGASIAMSTARAELGSEGAQRP